jgi:2-keto-4-pentenoate hydratase/2-oxohepta-3-ene-1,7-dioic acid hydratase in catechol pathway
MRRVRFRDASGTVRGGRWTTVEGEEVVTAASGPYGRIAFGDDTYPPEDVEILPPCEPTKIVCVGRNYAEHADERDEAVPDRPMLFLKGPNAVRSHGETVTLPAGDKRIEHEAELAVVISERCRNVAVKNAEDYVAGYTCFNDLSNRTDQDREQNWVRGKAFDGAAPIGPVVATPEHLPDDATIECYVNGERRQSSTIDHMIFSVADLIEEVSTYLTLEPGDVIATGTPEGVGPLEDGDDVSIEIEGVGELHHSVELPDGA